MHDIRWFHSIDLGEGLVTPGAKPLDILQSEAALYFGGYDLQGKSVIDIGAWDGFMSFEAERRGAKFVLATDHFCWSGPGWGTKAGFNFAHSRLRSNVSSEDVGVFDLCPKLQGIFDVALFLGVFYHLTDPWGGLFKAAQMTSDLLIVETATACNDIKEPVMRYYLGKELADDPTNFWAPNEMCLRNMLLEIGFKEVSTLIVKHRGNFAPRLIAHARKG